MKRAGLNSTLGMIIMAVSLALTGGIDTAMADKKYRDHSYGDRHSYKVGHKHHNNHGHYRRHVIHHGHDYHVPRDRVRYYRDTVVIRPHGHLYPGYAYSYIDEDVYKWLSFTAITLKVLDNLNESQQRKHEAAQIKATGAPLGERIIWNQGAATGSVTAIRDGTSTTGRYCREFRHEVSIGNKREQAYGTACRKPDGSWEVISTVNP